MLVLSLLVSIPGVIGMACESKEQKASEKAALHAMTGLSGGDTNSVTGEASFDGLIQNSDSPEFKEFSRQAKAQEDATNDLKQMATEAGIR